MAILILGATSEIALHNLKFFAQRGEHLILAARNVSAIRPPDGYSVQCLYYDAKQTFQTPQHAEIFWKQCLDIAQINWQEDIHGVYIAQGFLPSNDSKKWQDEIEKTIFLNFTSIAFFLETVAHWYENNPEKAKVQNKHPWIAVISSVAGDRGRFSNYPYGAAKAGLTEYLSGLRARLFQLGVHVLTIKPGLVQTRMIVGRPQEKSITAATPILVAREIDRAIRHRKNVLYTPHWWWYVMFFVRIIPEWIFKRMKF